MRRMIAAARFGRPPPAGGCIGVPAPASPFENRSDLLRGVEWCQARGYRVKLADGIEARNSYVAGDAKGRARDLEAMFDWSEQRPEWPRTKSLEQVLEEHLEPLGVPVLYGLPVGHAKHPATLPLGVTATLDADARTLTGEQPALRYPGGSVALDRLSRVTLRSRRELSRIALRATTGHEGRARLHNRSA
jgi:muramoyltetrapeptide carboxypeptidase LdcA involved in peptidoglycan recycling